jgi:predicted DCC family thiol-disulfide oxidoreductase YuxK
MRQELDIDGRLLVLFDGHCGFCNGSVRWFLARDRQDRLRFAPWDSPKVAALLARHGFSAEQIQSTPATLLAVLDPGGPAEVLLIRSACVLAMLRQLPQPWPAFSTALGWIPRSLRDLAYRLVARSRYRIAARLDSCPLPTPAVRSRFL